MAGGVAFSQLRTSTTLASIGLEAYTDGTLGADSIRVATGPGLLRGTAGIEVDGSEASFKTPVRVRATGNLTIAGPGATVDGVVLSVGDRVLADQQSTGTEDGIYEFQGAASAMTRTADAPVAGEAAGWYVPVLEGSTYADTLWRVDADLAGATIGTDGWTMVEIGSATATTLAGAGLVVNGAALDVNPGTGIEINADTVRLSAQGAGIAGGAGSTLSFDAAAADGDGLSGSGNTLTVVGGTAGGSVLAATVTASGVGIDVDSLDGNGLSLSGTTLTIDLASTVTFSGATWTFPTDELQITGTPDSDNDAVNKAYVDAVVSGLDIKESVLAATEVILAANSDITGTPVYDPTAGASSRGQITATLAVSGVFSVDGVTLGDGDRILVKQEKTGTAEVHSVDTVADVSDSLDGTFFVFYTTPNQGWYVWIDTDDSGTADPAPAAPAGVTFTGIEVTTIVTDDSSAAVATAIKAAIDGTSFVGKGGSPTVVIAGGGSDEITITNAQGGQVTDVADGSAPTGFTIATDTQGVGLGGAANGFYTVTIVTTALTLDRATDFDEDAEVTSGAFTFVTQGTVNSDTGWVLSTNNPITIGGAAGTPLTFTQFSQAGVIQAGAGLTKTGTTLNINSGTGTLNGITVAADAIGIALATLGAGTGGLVLTSNELEVKEDTASTGSVASVIDLNSNGVAVRVDDSSIEGSAAGGSLRVKALGITNGMLALLAVDTGQLAANAVTIAKLGIQFEEDDLTSSDFSAADPSVQTGTLTNTALVDSNGYGYVELYRNGVADMFKNATGTSMGGTGDDQFKIQAGGTKVEIGADISGLNNTYRVRYLSAL